MWNKPAKEDLAKIPMLYSQENTPLKEQIVYMHLFIGSSDWFITECDNEDICFGFAVINGDDQMAEWGYCSLEELSQIKVKGIEVDRDLYWKIGPAKEVEKIVQCQGW